MRVLEGDGEWGLVSSGVACDFRSNLKVAIARLSTQENSSISGHPTVLIK